MSRKLFIESQNISLIIDRIKKLKHLEYDKDVAIVLGMTKENLYEYKKRGAIPKKHLVKFANSEGKTIDWLLTGKKDPWWSYVPSVSRESLEWIQNQLDTDVIKTIIVTYHDDNFGNPQGFILVKSNGIVSMAGTATRSGYLGGGPNTYCDVLEMIKTKHIPTGIVELSKEESGLLDTIDISTLISRARFADDIIDSELSKVRSDKYKAKTINNDFEDDFAFIPQVTGKISAGEGRVPENAVEMKVAFRKDWIQRKGDPKSMVLIRVAGDSMEPTLLSGDLVLIDRGRNYIEPQGGIYAIALDDMIMIKRVQVLESGVRIISDNVHYEPIETPADRVKVNGKVIWYARELER